MKLEHPLATLIARCETICVSACCGIDAYDFSTIQLASGPTMYCGKPEGSELLKIRRQIVALKANYGGQGASARGVTLEDLNQVFTGERIDELANELAANLEVALSLMERSERRSYQTAEPAPASDDSRRRGGDRTVRRT